MPAAESLAPRINRTSFMPMTSLANGHTVGLLLSGGLDSSILLGHLLAQGSCVQPLYIRSNLRWEREELMHVERFLEALACPELHRLVTLDLPLDDLYGRHWSLTGLRVPDAASPDEAVYLPGRNPLLLVKAGVWCQLHGIEELALALLGSNPFSDATAEFFEAFQRSLEFAVAKSLTILRPFAELHKRDVMRLGRDLPLELTFSCIAPDGGLHCGRCNKCAERQAAFGLISLADPTLYATERRALA
jgi:7-cyano-7-deazaguanine synthase